ncbi:MAG: hydrogenase formation protein HypD, partial [Clostridium sp.]
MNINFDDYSIGKSIINNIHRECGKLDCDIKIMEVCGTHTRSIHKYAVPSLLPANLKLISGPGCPICVTPQEYISQGVKLAVSRDVIITTFSDVLRVPSSLGSLADARSRGADIRTVYSPLESLEIAKSSDKEVVFIGVGFETTAATIALTLINAKNYGIQNFSILNYLKSMPNALRAITYESPINGYICPGHVGSIIGNDVFNDLATERNIPMVMAGFNSLDILSSILMIINMINRGESGCRNLYKRAVKASGNIKGKNIISSVFDSDSSIWRGLSTIDNSGYK